MLRKLLVLILLTGIVQAQTKIMLLGDSITELDWQAGYRSQLYHLLQVGGYSFDFVGRSTTNHDASNLGFAFPTAYWDHEGYSNATIEVSSTYTWKNHLRAALTVGAPDIVCVMLGTNDVFSTIRNATQVRDAMSAFLDSIWAFNSSIKVVLSTMPRVFGYPTALAIIQSANTLWPAMVAAKQLAGRNISLVDNYAALTLSTDFVDGVHPSVGGYVKMANAWLPAVGAALSSTLPTGTFTASPLSLPVGGGNVTLSWTSNGATSASIDQGIGAVGLSGTRGVTVSGTTTFTLTLTNNTGGTRSYPVTVIVGTPPPVPVLASPANGATNQQTTMTLSWNAAAGATSYRLQVGTDSLCSNRIVDDSTTTATSRQVNGLGNQTRYYWRVRSQNTSGSSGFCQVRSFTTISLNLPTGTFSVTPDTLPVGGGSVTLTWTSNGATGASIDQGIGSVSLSGDTAVAVGQTKTFTLTLSNSSGSRSYATRVGVALPGGQGTQDITSQAAIIALVPNPTGGGNPNIEIIRDGITPPLGSGNVLDQFDTYTGGQPRDLDWIGYTFTTAKQFTNLIYQEGLDNQWGGCFQPLQVQVRDNGQWTDVQGLVSTPPYPGSNLVSFETYQLNFNSTTGDAIRIAGPPTGQGHYIGVGELRVLATSGTGIDPTPGVPKNFELMQNYPNPFNPTTTIVYNLPVAGHVVLNVFNVIGQRVATLVDEAKDEGRYSVSFVATRVADGVYFYSLNSGNFVETKKMILLK